MGVTPPLTFPQSRRLKTPAAFDAVYKRKRSAADGRLLVYGRENGLGVARLGVSVSKKVGNAVVRNRYKRLFREAFRLTRHDLHPGDYVMIPRPGPYPAVADLQESLRKLAAVVVRKWSQ